MPALTAPQLEHLRDGHPHAERFYLSIFKPSVTYVGTVTGSPARGATSVTLSDVSGDIDNAVIGNTVIIYDGTGAIISKRRLRGVSGNIIVVDENNVIWADGQTVIIYNVFELWSVFPYIDPDTLVFYKDRDIEYSDQNSKPNPVAIITGDRVAFLDGPSVTLSLDGSDSYTIADAATISSYAWSCESGSFSNANAATTSLTISDAGNYWLSLTVTDSNGKTQTLRIIIFIHTRTGADAPYSHFTVDSVSTSYDDGGASAGIQVFGVADVDTIADETAVVLWSEQYYDSALEYIGDKIIISGYIQAESIQRSPETGTVTFRIFTIHEFLKLRKMTSVSIEESSERATWYRFPSGTLTVARAVHHYLKWHSTIFNIANVYLPVTNTSLMSACDDLEAGKMYDAVDRFVSENGIFAHVCCDRAGNVHMDIDINMLPDAARDAIPTTLTVTAHDRTLNESDIEIVLRTTKVATVSVSGVAYDGSDYVPIISACPGEIPDTYGDSDVYFERLVIADQAEANFLSGRLFAYLNSPVEEVRWTYAGNYPADIIPQEWVVLADASNQRIDVDNSRFVIRSVDMQLDVVSGTRQIAVVAIEEAAVVIGDGQTVIPPDPDPTTDPPTPNYPPIELPKFPPIPNPPGIKKPPSLPKCDDGSSPNGPFNLNAVGTIDSVSGPTYIDVYYPCKLRESTADNPSTIIFTGSFWDEVAGILQPSNDNDFYEVLALNNAMQIVAEAVMTGSGSTREGIFNNASPVSVTFFRIMVTNTAYDPDTDITFLLGGGSIPGDLGTFGQMSYVQLGGGGIFHNASVGFDWSSGDYPTANPFGIDACCLSIGTTKQVRLQFDYTHSAGRGFIPYVHVKQEPCSLQLTPLFTNPGMVYPGHVDETFFLTATFGAGSVQGSGVGVHFSNMYTEGFESYSIGNVELTMKTFGTGCTAGHSRVSINSAFLYNTCR